MTRPLAMLTAIALVLTACGQSTEPTVTAPRSEDAAAEVADVNDESQPPAQPTTPGQQPEAEPDEPEVAIAEGGAPERPVLDLVEAFNAGDPLGVLAALDPAEREFFSRIYDTALNASLEQWPQFGGQADLAALQPVLDIENLQVEMLADHLAWVTVDSVRIDIASPPLVTSSWLLDDDAWVGAIHDNDDFPRPDWPFYVHPPGLVTVQVDGEWRVSLARTFAEFRRRNYDLPFEPTVSAVAIVDAATPIDAVEGLVAALDAHSWTDVRAHMVAPEAAAFADYEATLAAFVSDALGQLEFSVSAGGLTVIEESQGRAVVEFERLDLVAVGDWEIGDVLAGSADFTADIDGTCGRLEAGRNSYEGCADASDPYESVVLMNLLPDLGWQGPRLVTIEEDGQWRVSLSESLLLWVEPFAAEPLFTVLGLSEEWIWPGPWILLDEATEALTPLEWGESGTLTPVAAGRAAIGVIVTDERSSQLRFEGPGLATKSCSISLWLQGLESQDFSEGPDHVRWRECDDLEDLDLSPGLTIVVEADTGVMGSGAVPLAGDITVWHE